jgi:hypothetical protein
MTGGRRGSNADIRQTHTHSTPKIQTLVVVVYIVVHATVPNPERRLEYSSRGGEQGEKGKGDVRGVIELRLGEKCARVSCAFYRIFFCTPLPLYIHISLYYTFLATHKRENAHCKHILASYLNAAGGAASRSTEYWVIVRRRHTTRRRTQRIHTHTSIAISTVNSDAMAWRCFRQSLCQCEPGGREFSDG